jgi:sec-independent protein translocase protein TatB
MHFLLFLEFIGTTELLVVLIVAIVVFGPRKLPELGRSLGRALGQLQAASDDFKRTWETEARVEGGAVARRSPAAVAAAREEMSAGETVSPSVAQGVGLGAATEGPAVEGHNAAAAEASLIGAHG